MRLCRFRHFRAGWETHQGGLDAGGVIVAEVEFRELTPSGELRHPVVRDWHQG